MSVIFAVWSTFLYVADVKISQVTSVFLNEEGDSEQLSYEIKSMIPEPCSFQFPELTTSAALSRCPVCVHWLLPDNLLLLTHNLWMV